MITQRVYLTDDGRYVGEGDPDAAFLAYTPGTEVADRLVAHRGLEKWASVGAPAVNASVVIGPDASGRMTMTSAPLTTVPGPVPVGTVPPGHATASVPGIPAEVADPVVNADGTHRGEAVPVVRQQPTRTTPAGKPAARTTREV